VEIAFVTLDIFKMVTFVTPAWRLAFIVKIQLLPAQNVELGTFFFMESVSQHVISQISL
jgi:hypothetical protein